MVGGGPVAPCGFLSFSLSAELSSLVVNIISSGCEGPTGPSDLSLPLRSLPGSASVPPCGPWPENSEKVASWGNHRADLVPVENCSGGKL